jgi:Tol biopolymer transport system component
MYIIEVGCLETEHPCIGEPELLFELSPNGQGPHPPILHSDWSPDGQQVIVEAVGLEGKGDIFIGTLPDFEWTNLTNSPNYEGYPAWSSDGSRISFSRNSGEPDHRVDVFTVNPDGAKEDYLFPPDFSGVYQLLWFPDSEKVAFTKYDETGFSQIFVANTDGSNVVQLTESSNNHALTDISPDGKWIAYITYIDEPLTHLNIFVIQPNGSNETAITDETQGYRYNAIWHPVYDWMVFTGDMDVDWNTDIYLIQTDGTGLTQVTAGSRKDIFPSWMRTAP